jgi:uncharacterized protein (TIGR00369 family)
MSDFDFKGAVTLATQWGHNGALGFRYCDHGDAWVLLALDYDESLIGNADTGVMASGPIVSLMDMASGASVWLRHRRFIRSATLDLRIDYMRPAVPGRTIYGRAECYRTTRRIAFVRGQAYDDDPADPVAHIAGTFMIMEEARPA